LYQESTLQIPVEQLLTTLRPLLDRLLGSEEGFGSDLEAVRSVLTLLQNRERSGLETQQARLKSLAAEANNMSNLLRESLPEVVESLIGLGEEAQRAATLECLETVEDEARRLIADFARLTGKLTADQRLEASIRTQITTSLVDWDVSWISKMGDGRTAAASDDHPQITTDALTAYLADRFDEPGILVNDLQVLSGGFGKETLLFSVSGNALSGEFVMRRDRDQPILDNDCHRVVNEYPVVKAVYAQGFPAPEAHWVDVEPRLLPGGDFMIMRRAPGSPGGDVFSANSAISDELLTVLAKTLAELHALPPLLELGDLTESINTELWSMSAYETAKRYISSFRDIYVQEVVHPSPAILALYSWVLDHLPDSGERSVLCHGDIGFHNMVLDNGSLSALIDWEFVHIGDPAEDLAYVRNTAGHSLDWNRFLELYEAAGGARIDPARLHVFQVWGQLRNATASAIAFNSLVTGKLNELKLAHTGFYHLPMFIAAARDLIMSGPVN